MTRTAIVTGATRGIGRAVAIALAEEGFDIAAVGLPDATHAGSLGAEIAGRGRRCSVHDLDLAVIAQHDAVLDGVWRECGSVDVARVVRTMAAGLLPYTAAQEVRVDGGLLLTRF